MGSQRRVEFSRKMEDWQERNNGTRCAFDGSGCGTILSETEYADRRRNQIRKHKDNKDGYAERKSLNQWSNNDVTRTKLAKAPRKEYK
eukprot:8489579-Ditylum_brightwellii.AAC.1